MFPNTDLIPAEVRARLDVDSASLGIVDQRDQWGLVELRRGRLELRTNDDGSQSIAGYATTWDTDYDVAGGPPYGWSESIARGAATKSLAERDDVRFFYNHEGLVHARSRGSQLDTMKLTADDLGLLFEIPVLDTERNVFARALYSAIERGDVDQCSFAFQAIRQEWQDDYTRRIIHELRLVDVSAVSYPANPATIVSTRSHQQIDEPAAGMPLSLAAALAASL